MKWNGGYEPNLGWTFVVLWLVWSCITLLLCFFGHLVILSAASLRDVIGSSVSENDVQLWHPVSVARYSVLIKCRGVIKSKGYVTKAKRDLLSLIGWTRSRHVHCWHQTSEAAAGWNLILIRVFLYLSEANFRIDFHIPSFAAWLLIGSSLSWVSC